MRVFAVGYCGTGSSAIVHLLKEYSNCQDDFDSTFEQLLFYAPHGLFDLEDVLLHNNSLFRSDAAINDFYQAMKRLNDNDFGWFGGYQKKFGDKFMDIVNAFIDDLILYRTKGGWSNDYSYIKNKVKIRTRISYFIKKYILFKKISYPNSFRLVKVGEDGIINFSFPSPDEFYEKARKFINSYFDLLGYDSNKVLVIDQMLQPQQLERFMNYANNDDKFIVVKRDARDVFLKSKYFWTKQKADYHFPLDATEFSNFYRKFLSTEVIVNDPKIMRIQFEDMIYRYDDTINKIEKFIGANCLGKHIFMKRFFNPEQSVKNTQLFSINVEWKKEAGLIKELMPSEIYAFPYNIETSVTEVISPQPVFERK